MAVTCTNYDAWIACLHAEIYRFCLVLALDTGAARELTFQAYLRLGAGGPGMDEASARMALYAAAFSVAEAYHLKKLRRRAGKRRLCEALGLNDADPFIAYLQKPFLCRAAAQLLHIAGFTPEDTGKILRLRPQRAARLGDMPEMERIRGACLALPLEEDAQSALSDRLYLRFAERSVAFETRMLDLRQKFDRLVPYIALLILLVCAFAVLYSMQVSATLPIE